MNNFQKDYSDEYNSTLSLEEKFEVEIHTTHGGFDVAFDCKEITVVKLEYPT